MEEVPVQDIIYRTELDNLDLIPADGNLTGAGIEMLDLPEREFLLKSLLTPLSDRYDFIIIDSPPSVVG